MDDLEYFHNIYNKPERFGLELKASVDFGGSWEFDIFALFQDDDGCWFMAHDSGCSCPSPFEGYKSAESIHDGRVFSITDVEKFMMAYGAGDKSYAAINEFLAACRAAGLPSGSVVSPS